MSIGMNSMKIALSFVLTALVLLGSSNTAFGEIIPPGPPVIWSGTKYVYEPVVIHGTLIIDADTEVIITSPSNSKFIGVGSTGCLWVNGTEGHEVEFYSDDDIWNGIIFLSNTDSSYPSIISYANIKDAMCGIYFQKAFCYVYNTTFIDCTTGSSSYDEMSGPNHNVLFENCIAENCHTGFRHNGSMNSQDCLAYACDTGFKLRGVNQISQTFYNNRASYCTTGILVEEDSEDVNIGPYTVVDNNTGAGIETRGPAYISESQIYSNGGNGIWVLESGSAYVTDCRISNNYNNVVLEEDGNEVILGQATGGSYGNNKITDPVRYHVINRRTNTLKAENCYWGGKYGYLPILYMIGDVDFMPFLVEDPF